MNSEGNQHLVLIHTLWLSSFKTFMPWSHTACPPALHSALISSHRGIEAYPLLIDFLESHDVNRIKTGVSKLLLCYDK